MSEICDECRKVLPQIHDIAALRATETRALQSCHCICLHILQTAGAAIDHWTPLRLAAHLNHVECMKTLIETGADVNYTDGYISTPVQEAAKKGHEECVQILIKAGADVNYRKGIISTAVQYAAEQGHEECVRILMKAGADVKSGVLIRAVMNKHRKIVELLIKSGADVNEGSLGLAVELADKECVDLLLLSGANVNNIWHEQEYSTLIGATRGFRYEGCVESLINAGADVNSRSDDGVTSLMFAAERGDEKMVDTLIKAGANVNDVDDYGRNPLMLAVLSKNKTCVQLLIEAGADVNVVTDVVTEIPRSALADASETTAELVKMLIEAGADVNIPSVQGGILAFSSYVTVSNARMLLGAGAKINVFNDNNVNTLKRIIAENRSPLLSKDVCMLLFAAGETIDGTTVERADYYSNGKAQVPIPEFLLHQDLRFCLKHLCREAIRKHLLELDPHTHLFDRVPRLGLPAVLQEYLLYEMSLNDTDDDNSTN